MVRPAPIVAPLLAEDVAALVATCRNERPTVVLLEGVHLLHAAEALAEALPDLPLIVDMHNIESRLGARTDRLRLPRPLRPLSPLIHARRQQAGLQAELRIAALARQLWLCSDADRQEAERLFGPCRMAVVPNPIPPWALTTAVAPEPGTQEVLFVGHLGYEPNREAVALLCDEIVPRLRRMVPQARLHVCGRRPRRRTAQLVTARGHRLTADADDLSAVYAAAALTAMPLREGGGTRLKVLEAMAVGCPIVATAKAVEGLGLIPHVHYVAAETARDFAVAIAALLRDPANAARMAEDARRFALDRYGPGAHRAAVHAALAQAGIAGCGSVP